MKYLKYYESNIYNEGDYIIIKEGGEQITKLADKWKMFPYKCTQIVDFNGEAYYMETFDRYNYKYLIFWLLNDEIERKATEEEIIEFEAERDSKKYNI